MIPTQVTLKKTQSPSNFVKELELRIWGSSHLMKQQNLKIDPGKPGIQMEEGIIQRELWKLIKPEN